MGRHAQPVELILTKGRSHHLTRAEIEKRKAVQIKSGRRTFKASPQIMADPVALEKFKQLRKLFKNLEFVEGLDENFINRYCLTYSQLQALLEYQATNHYKLDFDDMLKLDARIDKKQDLLIKMEDRLFLNPVARLKNVPKKKEEPKEPSKFEKMFGDV